MNINKILGVIQSTGRVCFGAVSEYVRKYMKIMTKKGNPCMLLLNGATGKKSFMCLYFFMEEPPLSTNFPGKGEGNEGESEAAIKIIS